MILNTQLSVLYKNSIQTALASGNLRLKLLEGTQPTYIEYNSLSNFDKISLSKGLDPNKPLLAETHIPAPYISTQSQLVSVVASLEVDRILAVNSGVASWFMLINSNTEASYLVNGVTVIGSVGDVNSGADLKISDINITTNVEFISKSIYFTFRRTY